LFVFFFFSLHVALLLNQQGLFIELFVN